MFDAYVWDKPYGRENRAASSRLWSSHNGSNCTDRICRPHTPCLKRIRKKITRWNATLLQEHLPFPFRVPLPLHFPLPLHTFSPSPRTPHGWHFGPKCSWGQHISNLSTQSHSLKGDLVSGASPHLISKEWVLIKSRPTTHHSSRASSHSPACWWHWVSPLPTPLQSSSVISASLTWGYHQDEASVHTKVHHRHTCSSWI